MTTVHARPRRVLALAAIVALLSSAGCGGGTSKEKGKPLQTKTEAEVVALAQSYAQNVATGVGSTVQNWQTNAAPCQGGSGETAKDGRWNLAATANIPLPEAQHASALQQLRDQWQQQGWEITEFRTGAPANQRASLSGRNPPDGVTVSLDSTTPPSTALAVIIGTACYKPAPGEHPAS